MTAVAEPSPTGWRMQCAKCGRFIAHNQWGTIYTPYGPNLEYDDYTDICNCPKCGLQEVRSVPTRWVVVS